MKDIRKYIYFPTGQETGMKKDIPEIVYASDVWVDGKRMYITASKSPEEAARGSGSFLLAQRAVPYTDALWNDVENYLNTL